MVRGHSGRLGTGKTVLQHAIAKQATADVIIMQLAENVPTSVHRFLTTIHTGETHGADYHYRQYINMPVCARSFSVHTMTVAEYYREG